MSGKKGCSGRPTKYKASYCKSIVDFFSTPPLTERVETYLNVKTGIETTKTVEIANELPFLTKWAKKIGVEYGTVLDWVALRPDFKKAWEEAKRLQTEFIMTNGLRNNYNAVFAIFTMKNVGKWRDEADQNWTDRTELTGHGGKDLVPVEYPRDELKGLLCAILKEANDARKA